MNNKDRQYKLLRKTAETDIRLEINLDGCGETNIQTGFGMLDHMLTLLAFWADLDLIISCKGDTHIDAHHTVEDVGICFGTSLNVALGDKKGIARIGYGRVPMDEALAEVSMDISGRPWLEWHGDELLPPVIAHEEKDIWREFYKAFASSGKLNLHIAFLYGKNGHHLLESAAKGCGVALRQAISVNHLKIRSSKGELD